MNCGGWELGAGTGVGGGVSSSFTLLHDLNNYNCSLGRYTDISGRVGLGLATLPPTPKYESIRRLSRSCYFVLLALFI